MITKDQLKETFRKTRTLTIEATNRIIKGQQVKEGQMFEYLQERIESTQIACLDLKNEMDTPSMRSYEPGFYEKLFAELHAEEEMLEAIAAKLKL